MLFSISTDHGLLRRLTMHIRAFVLATIASFALANAAFAQASSLTVATTMASYPTGTFLENLSVTQRGDLVFTSYLDKRLYTLKGGGKSTGAPTVLAQLDVHPVGILARRRDIIVSAHGKSFTEGPSFTQTNQILVLNRSGQVLRRTAAPAALFVNGLVEVRSDVILIADSIGAKIWAYNPRTGDLKVWLQDPLLGIDPAQASQRPGANGLKMKNGTLYISNSARGALYKVQVRQGAPMGALALFSQTGPVDDFTFLSDGSIAAATHGAKLIGISPTGTMSDILSEGCDSCTSVTTFGRDQALVVLTTGNLLEGGKEPARVLRVSNPAQR
jgi:hypothetical protein